MKINISPTGRPQWHTPADAAVGRSSYSRVSEGTAPTPDTLAEPHRAPKRPRPIK